MAQSSLKKSQAQGQGRGGAQAAQVLLQQLKVGQCIDLIFSSQEDEFTDLRRTLLLDFTPQQQLVVSQPTRTIPKGIKDQRFEATILHRDAQTPGYTRLGFYTTITEFIERYRLAGSTQGALLLAPPQEVHRANLRSAFRVELPMALKPQINLLDEHRQPLGVKTLLMDLSTTGALITYQTPSSNAPVLSTGDVTYFESDFSSLIERLSIPASAAKTNSPYLQTPCRVIRITNEPKSKRCYVALQFFKLTMQQEDLLFGVLIKMQQFIASRQLA